MVLRLAWAPLFFLLSMSVGCKFEVPDWPIDKGDKKKASQKLEIEVTGTTYLDDILTIQVQYTDSFGKKSDVTNATEISSGNPAILKITKTGETYQFKCSTVGEASILGKQTALNLTATSSVKCQRRPGQFVIYPTFDVTADAGNYTGNFTSFRSASSLEILAYGSWNTVNRDALRGLIEFKLPDGVHIIDIKRIRLRLKSDSASGGSDSKFQIYGYEGNGSPELSDAAQTANLVAQVPMFTNGVPFLVVATSFAKSMNSNAQYIGFMIRGDEGQGSLSSAESPDETSRPALLIDTQD